MSYKQNTFSVTAGRDGSRYFRGDHDDRFNGNFNRGRGGRRNFRNNRRGQFRYNNPNSSSRFYNRSDDNDGDVAMGGDAMNRNQKDRQNVPVRGGYHVSRRPNRYPRQQGNYRKADPWYKVMVPFGSSLSKEELFGLITSEIQGPFEPVCYSKDERRAYFYIKGNQMAESLRSISRRITKPDGHKLIFHVSPSEPPLEHAIDDSTLEKLKLRMSDRYDPATQFLNLSAFYMDEGLQKENIFLPLNRASTMAAVTKIISENIPELAGLDVSNNKILSVRVMIDLVKAAPNVSSLNLGNNHIHNLDEMDKLKGWNNITELVLEGNDLRNSFSNETAYISAVRKKFPKVVKLDGKDLPPPITFDLDTTVSLPATKGSYFVNDEVQSLVVLFIKEYYTLFDSDKRRELMLAYHQMAQFSLFTAKNPVFERGQTGFTNFFDESRNLKKIGHFDSDKLSKKIKVGALSVVSCLETLPKTTHDMNSFVVDVSMATPTMMSFVLNGIFKENDSRSDRPVIRSFSRTFITVPSGPGMVITNDMWTISNASPEQIKNAFQSSAPTPSSSPVPSSSVAGPSTSRSATPVPFLTPAQIQMVENFSVQSGMNAEYSLKCLQENVWDYQKAGQIFLEVNSQGKIPPEAFVKS